MEYIDCIKCKAGCCIVTGHVVLSEEDIERIEKTGKGEFYTRDHKDRKVLKRIQEVNMFINPLDYGPCIFLDQSDEENAKCSIYSDRPKMCRDFSIEICKEKGLYDRYKR